jgi:integrase
MIAGLRSKPPTPHDLRRTCATQAALGVLREDRMAVLDHAQPGVHSKHYDHYERLAEKRAALAVWGRKREILAAPIVKAH